jgi:hypothetical protein
VAEVAFMETARVAELLKEAVARGLPYARMTNNGQLALGRDPLNPTSVIDFRAEAILPLGQRPAKQASQPEPPIEPRHKLSRQTGKYMLDFKGNITECQSLKELLAKGLRTIEKFRPGSLERLSQVKPRTKRIVARDPRDLFDQHKLVEDYAEKLLDGWWFGTNNSRDETIAWLRRGCELSGLRWGQDFSTSLQ